MPLGVATGGISVAAILAYMLSLPHGYIRPDAKPHGKGNVIEGLNVKDRRVVLFEDLVTMATSSAVCIKSLRDAGATVRVAFSITGYDFQESANLFASMNIMHYTALSFDRLRTAMAEKYSADQMAVVDEWHADPRAWTKKMEEQGFGV